MTKSMPAIALLTICVGMVVTPTATAAKFRDTSAGGACHAANGAAAAKFSFGNHYLTNNATTDQYVVCHFQMDDEQAELITTPLFLAMTATAGPASGGTVTCLAQVGNYSMGATTITASATRSAPLAAGASTTLDWSGVSWGRTQHYQVMTLNCRLPPGFRMGLIQWLQ